MIRRIGAPIARHDRRFTRLALWLAIATTHAGGVVWGSPLWTPPKTNAHGDVDENYYAALTIAQPGTSDLATRDRALTTFPWQGLSPDARVKAREVISGQALYRRLPTIQFAVDREVYAHLLANPDVAVSSWRAMEISQFELRKTAETVYHADAQDGSVGHVEVWKSTPEETLIYCDGAFKSPLLTKPIVARSLMRLTTRFYTAADGTPQAEHTGDVLVSFPSQTVETVARLISPVSYMIADRNFKQLTLYVHLMSQAMTRQPQWVESVARRMDVTEDQRRELLQLTSRVRATEERRIAVSLSTQPLPFKRLANPNSGQTSPDNPGLQSSIEGNLERR